MQSGKNSQIMIFDSGVGGLSICEAIMKRLPQANLTFACDNEGFPYGTKGEAELVARVELVLDQLIAAHKPDLLVVACNTASTVALPKIRNKFSIPVVGVVPAIKPAAAISKSKVIGLLATPATVQRPYTQQLIDEFASDCTIIRVGSSELVQMAEDKMRGNKISQAKLKDILAPFFSPSEHSKNKLDTIVLACTHFPLLKEDLQKAAPCALNWIDSGDAIALRVETLLKDFSETSIPRHQAVFTRQDASVDELLPVLKRMGFD